MRVFVDLNIINIKFLIKISIYLVIYSVIQFLRPRGKSQYKFLCLLKKLVVKKAKKNWFAVFAISINYGRKGNKNYLLSEF